MRDLPCNCRNLLPRSLAWCTWCRLILEVAGVSLWPQHMLLLSPLETGRRNTGVLVTSLCVPVAVVSGAQLVGDSNHSEQETEQLETQLILTLPSCHSCTLATAAALHSIIIKWSNNSTRALTQVVCRHCGVFNLDKTTHHSLEDIHYSVIHHNLEKSSLCSAAVLQWRSEICSSHLTAVSCSPR